MDNICTLRIEDAEQHDCIADAIAARLDGDCPYIAIGMPEQPVTVDGCLTPFQGAGTTLEDVIGWLHSEGGAPSYVFCGQQIHTVADAEDYDGDDADWEWIEDSVDIEVHIEWPDKIPDDLDHLRRLAQWARDENCDLGEASQLRSLAEEVLDILADD